jgi:hypothetical protein
MKHRIQQWRLCISVNKARELFKESSKKYGSEIEVIGREKEIGHLRSFFNDASIKAIIVFGPKDIGKTRLILESLSENTSHAIVKHAIELTVEKLESIITPKRTITLIIDDPQPNMLKSFVEICLKNHGLKLIITAPNKDYSLETDERIRHLEIKPLTEEDQSRLIDAKRPGMDFGLKSWIIDNSGGNPGVLLLACNISQRIRTDSSIVRNIGKEFEKRVLESLDLKSANALKVLSLFTKVGIKGKVKAELMAICNEFKDIDSNGVLNCIDDLQSMGHVQINGRYAEVIPPIFANYLTVNLIAGKINNLDNLFNMLQGNAKDRLLKHLVACNSDEVVEFFDAFFEPERELGNWKNALKNMRLFRIVAAARPRRSAETIHSNLTEATQKEILLISGEERRELLWTLEELLFREETSLLALESISLLALAENENIGNSATGVFCECFIPFHPQLPISLKERENFISEMLLNSSPKESNLLALMAVELASERTGYTILRKTPGAMPFDKPSKVTYGEIWNYQKSLINSVFDLRKRNPDDEVVQEASRLIPKLLRNYGIQNIDNAKYALSKYEEILEIIFSGNPDFKISEISSDLAFLREKMFEAGIKETNDVVKYINRLLQKLDSADFDIKIKRWAGQWTYECHQRLTDSNSKHEYRFEDELDSLANEANQKSEVLNQGIIDWLCSKDAEKSFYFFTLLGQNDRNYKWIKQAETTLFETKCRDFFVAYLIGLSNHSPDKIQKYISDFAKRKSDYAEEAIKVMTGLNPTKDTISSLKSLIRNHRISREFVVEYISSGKWSNHLKNDDFLNICNATLSDITRDGHHIISLIHGRLTRKAKINEKLTELAWKCLRYGKPISIHNSLLI